MTDHQILVSNAAATGATRTQLAPSSGSAVHGPPAGHPPLASGSLPYDRLLRLPEVLRLCALSRSTLYNKIANGHFPKQVRLGVNIVAWYESDILGWMQSPT